MNIRKDLKNTFAAIWYAAKSFDPDKTNFVRRVFTVLDLAETSLEFKSSIAEILNGDDDITISLQSPEDLKRLPTLFRKLSHSKAVATKIETPLYTGLTEILKVVKEANENMFDPLHNRLDIQDIDISEKYYSADHLFADREFGQYESKSELEIPMSDLSDIEELKDATIDALCDFLQHPEIDIVTLNIAYNYAFCEMDDKAKLFYAMQDKDCNIKALTIEDLQQDVPMVEALKSLVTTKNLSYVREYFHSGKDAPEQSSEVKGINAAKYKPKTRFSHSGLPGLAIVS